MSQGADFLGNWGLHFVDIQPLCGSQIVTPDLTGHCVHQSLFSLQRSTWAPALRALLVSSQRQLYSAVGPRVYSSYPNCLPAASRALAVRQDPRDG